MTIWFMWHIPLFDNSLALHLRPLIAHHFDTGLFPPYRPWLVSGFRFRSKMTEHLSKPCHVSNGLMRCLTWCNSVKSFICSSKRSARYLSPSRAFVTSWKSLCTPCNTMNSLKKTFVIIKSNGHSLLNVLTFLWACRSLPFSLVVQQGLLSIWQNIDWFPVDFFRSYGHRFLQCDLTEPLLWHLPRWNAIASHTAALAVIFIAEFTTSTTLIAAWTSGAGIIWRRRTVMMVMMAMMMAVMSVRCVHLIG